MKKLAITLSDEIFSYLEEIRADEFCPRSKSREIGLLIRQAWLQLQEEKRELTPAELSVEMKINALRYEKMFISRQAKKASEAANYVVPCADQRIIQFPVRQIGQFSGGA